MQHWTHIGLLTERNNVTLTKKDKIVRNYIELSDEEEARRIRREAEVMRAWWVKYGEWVKIATFGVLGAAGLYAFIWLVYVMFEVMP